MSELLLICRIAGRRAAIPALQVHSVIEMETITPVPRAPDHILGLTALRSQALTVIDTSRALGFDRMTDVAGERAAVVEHDGHVYALVLEETNDVEMALSDPQPLPGGFGDEWHQVARGMSETAGGPALVICVEKLIQGRLREAA